MKKATKLTKSDYLKQSQLFIFVCIIASLVALTGSPNKAWFWISAVVAGISGGLTLNRYGRFTER